jgi:hypothetical protein
MSKTEPKSVQCLTCYGTGEAVVEGVPGVCPDCFGAGKQLSESTKVEWRLREIERTYRHSGHETEGDVLWMVHEVRKAREVLLRILARCQDADESDATARDIKFQANEALGIYDPS